MHPHPSSPSGSNISDDWQESQSLVYGHSSISSRPNTAEEATERSGLWPELGVESVEATQDSTGDWTTSLGFDSGFTSEQKSKKKKKTHGAKRASKAQLRQVKSMHNLGMADSPPSPSFSPDQIKEVSRLETLAQEGFARRRKTSAGSARLFHVKSSKAIREQQSFHTAPDASIEQASAPRSSDSSYMPASMTSPEPASPASPIMKPLPDWRYKVTENMLRQGSVSYNKPQQASRPRQRSKTDRRSFPAAQERSRLRLSNQHEAAVESSFEIISIAEARESLEINRRKSFPPSPISARQASFDLHLSDHDDAASGEFVDAQEHLIVDIMHRPSYEALDSTQTHTMRSAASAGVIFAPSSRFRSNFFSVNPPVMSTGRTANLYTDNSEVESSDYHSNDTAFIPRDPYTIQMPLPFLPIRSKSLRRPTSPNHLAVDHAGQSDTIRPLSPFQDEPSPVTPTSAARSSRRHSNQPVLPISSSQTSNRPSSLYLWLYGIPAPALCFLFGFCCPPLWWLGSFYPVWGMDGRRTRWDAPGSISKQERRVSEMSEKEKRSSAFRESHAGVLPELLSGRKRLSSFMSGADARSELVSRQINMHTWKVRCRIMSVLSVFIIIAIIAVVATL